VERGALRRWRSPGGSNRNSPSSSTSRLMGHTGHLFCSNRHTAIIVPTGAQQGELLTVRLPLDYDPGVIGGGDAFDRLMSLRLRMFEPDRSPMPVEQKVSIENR
jgi:hypothetical protein